MAGTRVRSSGVRQATITGPKRVVQYLVYSNVLISLSGAGMVLTAQLLTGVPVAPAPIFLGFVSPFLVYTLDRVVDAEADRSNVPMRATFLERCGTQLLAASVCLFVVGMGVALARSVAVLALLAAYPLVGALYTIVDTKRILFVKNAVVGVTWGTIALLVGAYYGVLWTPEILFLFGYYTVAWVLNTIVFDVKDIEGDRLEGVRTIPNTYGLAATRRFSHVLNGALGLTLLALVWTGVLAPLFLTFLVLNGYVAAYTQAMAEDHGYLFYGFVVDGEYILLANLVLSTWLLSPVGPL